MSRALGIALGVPAMRRGNVSSPLLTDLVAYWKLDEVSNGSGAIARSDSIGASQLTDNGTTPSTPGVVGNAASFTAANSEYLNCVSNAALQTGDIDFTFAVWVNLTTAAATQWIASKWTDTTAEREWFLRFNLTINRLEFGWYIDASGTFVKAAADVLGIPQTGTNYLVVCRRNKVTQKIDICVNAGNKTETTGATSGNSNTGGFYIGANYFVGNVQSYANAFIDEAGIWKRCLTDAEITTLYNGGSGNTHPFDGSTPQPTALIIFDGNSMTDDDFSSYPATAVASLSGSWNTFNFGLSGQTTIEMIADAAAQIDPLLNTGYANNIVVCWEGTNDLKLGAARADAQARLVQYCQDRQAAGWQVVILTILPRTQVGLPETFEADRSAINTYIRENFATFADAVADVADNTDIGEAGDSDNATYYADGIHLTTAGYNIVAGIVAAAVNGL